MTPALWFTLAAIFISAFVAHYFAQRAFIRDMFRERIVKLECDVADTREITQEHEIRLAKIETVCKMRKGPTRCQEDSTDPSTPPHVSHLHPRAAQ